MPRPNHVKRAKARRDKFIKSLNIGKFEGKFSLEWIGPDLFRYIPDKTEPFHFIRKDSNGQPLDTVQPEIMETDGGSIPKIAQVFIGTSSWEYGPAYMIHDWEFEAHDRARDNASFDFDKSFEEVNLTLVEAIWTLMKEGYLNYPKPKINKGNVYTIYQGVMSPIARSIWYS